MKAVRAWLLFKLDDQAPLPCPLHALVIRPPIHLGFLREMDLGAPEVR